MLFELGRADAEAASESSQASAAAGPAFAAMRTAAQSSSSSSSSGRSGTASSSMQALLSGELQLSSKSPGDLLAGRPVVGLTGPPTAQAAAAAAAAISAAAGLAAAANSSHLLLACYGPASMPAAAAAAAAELQHGLAGLGCLCVWDLLTASTQSPAAAAAAVVVGVQEDVSVPHGVLQLLVSEGKPTCCCWGSGEAAATLIFAGAWD